MEAFDVLHGRDQVHDLGIRAREAQAAMLPQPGLNGRSDKSAPTSRSASQATLLAPGHEKSKWRGSPKPGLKRSQRQSRYDLQIGIASDASEREPPGVELSRIELCSELLRSAGHICVENVLDDADFGIVVERQVDVLLGDEVDRR